MIVEKNLAASREKARCLIMSGAVKVNGERVLKPGKMISSRSKVTLKEAPRFVSRGGDKIDGFFHDHCLEIKDKVCLDIGSSTGGFTDCLLKRGAKKVYAVDVGKGLIDWKLRNDPRVVLLEEINARYLSQTIIQEVCDIGVIDVSFISVEKIIPSVYNLISSGGFLLVLVKPQFEAGRESVGKGGIVKDARVHQKVIERVKAFSEKQGFTALVHYPSRIRGSKGNQEYFLLLQKHDSGEPGNR